MSISNSFSVNQILPPRENFDSYQRKLDELDKELDLVDDLIQQHPSYREDPQNLDFIELIQATLEQLRKEFRKSAETYDLAPIIEDLKTFRMDLDPSFYKSCIRQQIRDAKTALDYCLQAMELDLQLPNEERFSEICKYTERNFVIGLTLESDKQVSKLHAIFKNNYKLNPEEKERFEKLVADSNLSASAFKSAQYEKAFL